MTSDGFRESGGMTLHSQHATHPHPRLSVKANDPRELLASIAATFHEIPAHSIVIVGCRAPRDPHAAFARIRLGPPHDSLPAEAISSTIATLVREGAQDLVALVIGDLEQDTRGNFLHDFEQWASAQRMARDFRDAVPREAIDRFVLVHAYGGGITAPVSVESGEAFPLDHLGALQESEFAATFVSHGHALRLTRENVLGLSAAAQTQISDTWNEGTYSIPVGPDDPFILFERLLESGAGADAWLASVDPDTRTERLAVVERLAIAMQHGPCRDELMGAIAAIDAGEYIEPLEVVARMVDDPSAHPGRELEPGGLLTVIFDGWRQLWHLAEECDAPEQLREGFAHLVAVGSFFTWWGGRLGEAHDIAEQVFTTNDSITMAELVTTISREGITPPWLERPQGHDCR